jgi:hypothetical protein
MPDHAQCIESFSSIRPTPSYICAHVVLSRLHTVDADLSACAFRLGSAMPNKGANLSSYIYDRNLGLGAADKAAIGMVKLG